ncbi:hypothetical protein Tco_1219929 [Tanacetum coccineum]
MRHITKVIANVSIEHHKLDHTPLLDLSSLRHIVSKHEQDSDDEVLANNDDDDDDVAVVYSGEVARGHGGDGGVDDRPLHIRLAPFAKAGEAREKIQFELNDRGTLLPLGDHAAQWSNLLGEIVREFLMYYPFWHKIKEEKKAGDLGTLMQYIDLTPHIQSKLWSKIKKGIEQHMAKIYVDNKSALKKEHWVLKPDGTRDVAEIRS